MALLERWTEETYVLLRVMMGFMLTCHGVQKLFGLLEGHGHPHGLLLLAGVIEFAGVNGSAFCAAPLGRAAVWVPALNSS